MSLLDLLFQPSVWEQFYEYKASLACQENYAKKLRSFIDEQRYLPVCDAIARGERFPLPRRAVISKMSTGKKRVVYIYPEPENTVLKLLTWLLLRRYDELFSDCLYSFRPNRTAKDAVRGFLRTPGIRSMYAYKADIHDYFNSIPMEQFLPILSDAISDDPKLLEFLSALLIEPTVLEQGQLIEEQKGIMAGTPLAAFYANLYLKDIDEKYSSTDTPYARYSDDVIIFAETQKEVEERASAFRKAMEDKGLTMNPEKEEYFLPDEGWVFLGFRVCGDVVDIAPATVKKLKAKMRRKARALKRWADRKPAPGDAAATAFIRTFNRKLLEGNEKNELTWSRWFFSVINTTESLHEIDLYCQDCMRFLISGSRTKSRYNVSYEYLKRLGYRCLLHEYYSFNAPQNTDITSQTKS